jgi:hypothetical protein
MKALNQSLVDLKATGPIFLSALLLCSLAVPTTAQTISRTAAERGFTVAPNVSTPIVLKSTPDAPCDLHADGGGENAHVLRFYANGDGYLKVHAKGIQESEDGVHVQLDCIENGAITRYPLHLRASSSPTKDMPAPLSVMPTPEGSKILPALTEADALQLSDDVLAERGYPIRPDSVSSPDRYAKWLDRVSRRMTLVPSHMVSRSDISHQTAVTQAGVTAGYNWSGYIAEHANRSYSAVAGNWNVPEIVQAEGNHSTFSAFWVGLDGAPQQGDLVQAGTEQDCLDIAGFGYLADYSAWTELLPNQLSEQDVSLSPNPGDRMGVEVWISTGGGAPNANGAYAAFRIDDVTQNQSTGAIYTPLGSTYYHGSEAEWIMERPCLQLASGTTNCAQFAELSDYDHAQMLEATALATGGSWKVYSSIETEEMWLYNGDYNGDDNNLLSEGMPDIYADSATDIYFQFLYFH